MEYLAFASWCFLVALAGGLVGLVLGNIRLPATLLLASSPAAGAGANLAISAAAAGTASIAHVRAGRVNWRLFRWMAPPSILGAVAGGLVSGLLPGDALLLAIAVVLLYSAWDLRNWEPKPKGPETNPGDGDRDGPGRGRTDPSALGPVQSLDYRAAVIAGLTIGFLGGVVGLILGSLRMPALIKYVGEAPARAVGTNVTVGLLVGVFGALAHLPNAAPDLDVMLIGCLASIPGALLGSRLTGRLDEKQLVRAVAVILLVVGLSMVVQALA